MSWADLALTVGIVAAGVVLVALIVDWTVRRYVILAPGETVTQAERVIGDNGD